MAPRLLIVLVLIGVSCAAQPTPGVGDASAAPAASAAPLVAMPAAGLRMCDRTRFVGPACPSKIPATEGRYRIQAIGTPDSPAWILDLQSGAPYPGIRRRNAPPRFAHVVITAGDFGLEFPAGRPSPLPEAFDPNRTSGIVLRTATWGGKAGTLILAPPYPLGGIDGDHLLFMWSDDGTNYTVSLHSWKPLDEAAAILQAVVESIAPTG